MTNKISLILIMCGLFQFSLIGQSLTSHDPAIENASIALNDSSDKGTVSFQFTQYLSDYLIGGKRHPVQMVLCFTNIKPENGIESIHGDFASKFSWEYDPTINCAKAMQIDHLYVNQSGNIAIDIQSIQKITCTEGEKMGFNVNLQPAPCMNGINNVENDNIFSYTCAATLSSTTEVSNTFDCTVFPNPIENNFVLELNKFTPELEVELVDIQGKILESFSFENTQKENISIKNYASGIYYLKIKSEGISATKKITIVKS